MSHSVLIMSRDGRKRESGKRCDDFLEKRTTRVTAEPDQRCQKLTQEAPTQPRLSLPLPTHEGLGTGQTKRATRGGRAAFLSPASSFSWPLAPRPSL